MKCCDTCRWFVAPKGKESGACSSPVPSWAEVLENAVGWRAARTAVATGGTECDAWQDAPA